MYYTLAIRFSTATHRLLGFHPRRHCRPCHLGLPSSGVVRGSTGHPLLPAEAPFLVLRLNDDLAVEVVLLVVLVLAIPGLSCVSNSIKH